MFFHHQPEVEDVVSWPSDIQAAQELLRKTFTRRKADAMTETVAEELLKCPLLEQPEFVSIAE